MLRSSKPSAVHHNPLYQSTLIALRKAEDDKVALQNHLQRTKDHKALLMLEHLNVKIATLEKSLENARSIATPSPASDLPS